MSKAEIAAKFSGRRYRTIQVDGETITLQSLTASERAGWDASQLDDEGKFSTEKAQLANERLAMLCWVDTETKARVFPEPSDIAFLCGMDAAKVRFIAGECVLHINQHPESIAKNS